MRNFDVAVGEEQLGKYEVDYNDFVIMNELEDSEFKIYRIRALKDFGDVKAGDLGGYIQTEKNLSHFGNCWIYDEAKAFDNAMIKDNAKIYGLVRVGDNAIVSDDAIVRSENMIITNNAIVEHRTEVSGNGFISGDARIQGRARVNGEWVVIEGRAVVTGFAKVYGRATLDDRVFICEHAEVFGDAKMFGNAQASGNAKIYGSARIFGNSRVKEYSKVYGNSVLKNDVQVRGMSKIKHAHIGTGEFNDKARIKGSEDYIYIERIGSETGTLTAFKTKNGIRIIRGCFEGTLEEFKYEVSKVHAQTKYIEEYDITISLIEKRLGGE